MLFLAFILQPLYGEYTNRLLLLSKEQETKAIIEDMTTLPGAVFVSSKSSHKYKDQMFAYTVNIWSVQFGYEKIREHYEQEFTKNGWKYKNENYSRSRSGGQKSVTYTKGEYTATLYYWDNEDKEKNQFQYYIELTWEEPYK